MVRTNKISKILLWSLSLNILLSTSCMNPIKEDDSTTQWGHLSYIANAVFVRMRPQTTVTVCADYEPFVKYVQDAILKWAQPIGRDQHIQIAPCSGGYGTITVAADSGAPTAYINPQSGAIRYNPRYRGSNSAEAIMLHEIGHAWGMCDQYQGPNNCDPQIHQGNNNKVGASIMGPTSANKLQLTNDDIEGIKYVATRSDISANTAWQSFLGTNPAPTSSNTTYTNTSSGSSNSTSTGTGTSNGTSTTTPTPTITSHVIDASLQIEKKDGYNYYTIKTLENVAIVNICLDNTNYCTFWKGSFYSAQILTKNYGNGNFEGISNPLANPLSSGQDITLMMYDSSSKYLGHYSTKFSGY